MTTERFEDLTVSLSTAPTLPVAPTGPDPLPALYAPDPRAACRVVEFFTAHIRNSHTRKAYAETAAGFADWCHSVGLHRPQGAETRSGVDKRGCRDYGVGPWLPAGPNQETTTRSIQERSGAIDRQPRYKYFATAPRSAFAPAE